MQENIEPNTNKGVEQTNNPESITNPETNANPLYINWDDYFATFALMTSLRSKDPDRKVGAVIVSKDNRILSTGYNGAPLGISDEEMPWTKVGDTLKTKYAYVVHAELNAILGYNNDKSLLKGAKIYTTLFPCNECMKAIIQSGITEVVYLDNHNFAKDTYTGARYMINIHNKNNNVPKITLRAYTITAEAKNLMINAILENRTIVPNKKVEEYDETMKLSLKNNRNK